MRWLLSRWRLSLHSKAMQSDRAAGHRLRAPNARFFTRDYGRKPLAERETIAEFSHAL